MREIAKLTYAIKQQQTRHHTSKHHSLTNNSLKGAVSAEGLEGECGEAVPGC